ncbi:MULTISPECIES: sulfate ABC transporter substrate-binding protein [Cupriavidus]|jgi:sulfate transport system substrate-binding protein|uniref:Sulfate ABC transporter substrate-binding protein n=1 Tax=Cupriavidus pauculus TaxID=82633 RepID=A0A5P2HAF8_9BURK|nr:sulfate ABC transporter substrate-binding protein [Cupriavidus pauculus]QET05207.1 sulfate ABC transporter substrate-binding protein [Cupriavidus pauculus]
MSVLELRRSLRHILVAASLSGLSLAALADTTILNAAYDVTRELYKDINPGFVAQWKKDTGETVTVNQSHGGSSKQARSVADGLEADVVTMNQETDIDLLVQRGIVASDWKTRLPNNASPYYSTIVFLVRKGNPKQIHDWDDLGRAGVQVIVPNPKTSGNGRYTYLAAWGAAIRKGGTEAQAREAVTKLFRNVPVLDTGGRGATTTFTQRQIGDVLATFESEVHQIRKELGDNFEVVYPSQSIIAEAPVAVVDKVVDKRGTRKVATAYLQYLWSEPGQEQIAKQFNRPRSAAALKAHADVFKPIKLFSINEVFGSWAQAQARHFNDGGEFDKLYQARK